MKGTFITIMRVNLLGYDDDSEPKRLGEMK